MLNFCFFEWTLRRYANSCHASSVQLQAVGEWHEFKFILLMGSQIRMQTHFPITFLFSLSNKFSFCIWKRNPRLICYFDVLFVFRSRWKVLSPVRVIKQSSLFFLKLNDTLSMQFKVAVTFDYYYYLNLLDE